MADKFMTLLDLKNSMEPGDGKIASVAEIMIQNNEILNDIPFTEGNLVTGDVSFVREVMPKGTIRKINEGLTATKSAKKPKQETCVLISDRAQVDMNELKLAPEQEKYLLTENKAHIASLGETFAEMMIYGVDPEGITGFATRHNKLDGPNARQIVNAGGTSSAGTLTSAYFVVWDSEEVTGIYPKNAAAGLDVVAQANVYMPDNSNSKKQLLCHVTEYNWYVGLKVRDQRYCSRLCNIDLDGITNDVLFRKFIEAKNRLLKTPRMKAICYVSPDLYTRMEIAAFEKSNANVSYKEDVERDTTVVKVAGITVKENDCQLGSEKPVA